MQLIVEQLKVEGVERFVVIIAVFVQRGVFPVYKIIVQRNGVGAQAVGHQLHRKPFAESCFSGRRRAGDQYELYAVAVFSPVIDFIGNLSNLFLLKGFCYVNEVGCMSGFACQIEVAYIA